MPEGKKKAKGKAICIKAKSKSLLHNSPVQPGTCYTS